MGRKKILVVRFKQIGDAVLASPLCDTLKKTFPDSEIDYVVYDHIVPLFKNHPSIDNVISITEDEQKNPLKYIKKVWKVTRKKYDIIIDIMSTPKSEVFTLFGRSAKYRIGREKPKRGYTYTHKIPEPADAKDKVDKFLKMLKPLGDDGIEVKYDHDYKIAVTKEEKEYFKSKMMNAGINFERPIFAFAINSRRSHKVWKREYMIEVINHVLKRYKAQVIFYYSPDEKGYAKETHELMKNNEDIFSNIETKSIRELAMLLSNCDFFAGNEGGPRHIAQGVNVPSFAIFSPAASKKEWLSNANDRHQGIEVDDIDAKEYFDIKPQHVIEKIDEMVKKYVVK